MMVSMEEDGIAWEPEEVTQEQPQSHNINFSSLSLWKFSVHRNISSSRETSSRKEISSQPRKRCKKEEDAQMSKTSDMVK